MFIFTLFFLGVPCARAHGDLAVHSALIPCLCVCVCVCLSVRYQTPFSSRHESGPSWFLSTGKHPVVGQLPRVSFSALPGQSSDRPNLPPHKKLWIFSFLSPVFGEHPPKHAVDKESEESIVQGPNGQARSFREPPSLPSCSTGPWSSCIVTGHDQIREQWLDRLLRLLHAACQ